jgi:hypothetical protein
MTRTSIQEVFQILEAYEVTTQDIDSRWPDIFEKEGFVLTKDEIEYIKNEYYLGITE